MEIFELCKNEILVDFVKTDKLADLTVFHSNCRPERSEPKTYTEKRTNPVPDPLEKFTALRKSSRNHQTIRIASSDNELAAIGSDAIGSQRGHARSETFSFETNQWISRADYPFDSAISDAPGQG